MIVTTRSRSSSESTVTPGMPPAPRGATPPLLVGARSQAPSPRAVPPPRSRDAGLSRALSCAAAALLPVGCRRPEGHSMRRVVGSAKLEPKPEPLRRLPPGAPPGHWQPGRVSGSSQAEATGAE
jgi:hypothetical protein